MRWLLILLLAGPLFAQAPDATIGRLKPGMTPHQVKSVQGPPSKEENFSGRLAYAYLNPRDPRLVRLRVLFRNDAVSSIYGQSLECRDQLLLTGDTQSRAEMLLGPPDTASEHWIQDGQNHLERALHYRTAGHYLTVFLREGLVRSFRIGAAPWRYGRTGTTD